MKKVPHSSGIAPNAPTYDLRGVPRSTPSDAGAYPPCVASACSMGVQVIGPRASEGWQPWGWGPMGV